MQRPLILTLLILAMTFPGVPGRAESETPVHVLKSAAATRDQYGLILNQVLQRQQREVRFYREKFVLALPAMIRRLQAFVRDAGPSADLSQAVALQTRVYRQVLDERGNSYRENFRELARQYQELLGRHAGTAPEEDPQQLLQKLNDPSGDSLTARLTESLESSAVWEELIHELDQQLQRGLNDR